MTAAISPAPDPTPAPVPVDLKRILQLAQALLAAHDQRIVNQERLALAELMREIRALPSGTVPVLPRVEPTDKLHRELDGTTYEMQAVEGCVVLKILDVGGDDTVCTFDAATGATFVADFEAVRAKAGGRRG